MTTPTPPPEHGITPEHVAGLTDLDPSTENLQKVIDAVVDGLRRYCGWHIWPAKTETLTVDGEGGHVLTLPTLRVTAVDGVVDAGHALGEGDYEWSSDGDLKRLGGCWSTRWRGILVDLTHGYEEVPRELLGAIADAVEHTTSMPMGMTQVGPFQWGAISARDGGRPGGGDGRWQPAGAVVDYYRLPGPV